jgi:hypothetical protein
MAGFVQIVEYRTSKPDEVRALSEDYRKSRESAGDGSTAPARAMTCGDRDDAGRYFTIVEFESPEAAMENSSRADTTEFAKKMMELCDGPPTFRNLDLLDTM